MLDACDRCALALVAGEYEGGCEDCDALLCASCADRHGFGNCGGSFA